MREYLKLALRNLMRYKRRTILTGLGMLIGGLMLTLNQSFGTGIERQLIYNMIASDTGHIRITGHAERKDSDFEEAYSKGKPLISNPVPIEAILLKQPGLKNFSKQINFTAMVSNGFKLKSGMIIGVEPEKEQDLWQHVIPAKQGKPLTKGDRNSIYINNAAAKIFQVGIGDILSVIAQTKDGNSNALDLAVKGIYQESLEGVGAGKMYVLLSTAQELGQFGNGVNQIKVYLNDPNLAVKKATALSRIMAKENKIDIQDWKSAGGFFYGTVLAFQIFGDILCLVLFIVVATSIMNTMLMAVYGRTREIGTMMAMGTKRRQILGLFVTEALVLGVIATGAGVLLGSLFTWLLGQTGVPAFTESMKYAFGGDRVYPYLTSGNVLISSSVIIVLTVLASIYPAWTASRLKPVEALHHV
jgi:putative ABC transport system permease protein